MMTKGYLETWARNSGISKEDLSAKWEAWKATLSPNKRDMMDSSEFGVQLEEARFRVFVAKLAEEIGKPLVEPDRPSPNGNGAKP